MGLFAFQPKPDLIARPEFIGRPNHFLFGKSFDPDVPVGGNPLRSIRLLPAANIMGCRKPVTDCLFDLVSIPNIARLVRLYEYIRPTKRIAFNRIQQIHFGSLNVDEQKLFFRS